MKNPIDTVKGKIIDYDGKNVLIKVPYEDDFTFKKREYSDVLVQFMDNRELSYKQRNSCYAMIREISEYTGMEIDDSKMWLKIRFMIDELHSTADEIFSLQNAPKSLVCAFQRFIARFIVKNDIPTKKPMLEYISDQSDFIYSCLVGKKCCICGDHSDLHHIDAVGAGRNRNKISHEGLEVMPLCRTHHTEYHKIGHTAFLSKYHLEGGINIDKPLCKLYGLKYKENGGNLIVEFEEELN